MTISLVILYVIKIRVPPILTQNCLSFKIMVKRITFIASEAHIHMFTFIYNETNILSTLKY